MNNLGTVLGWELKEYFKSKGFMLTTLVIAILALVGLSLPRFIDLGFNKGPQQETEQSLFEPYNGQVLIYDSGNYLIPELVTSAFPNAIVADSEAQVETAVKNQEIKKGYVINSPTSYKSYVYNSEMYSKDVLMDTVLQVGQGMKYASEHNIDYMEFQKNNSVKIDNEQVILGKDTVSNYWYTYALVILVFIMVMMYGTMIATSVTTEKSNRSIEVLVTTTSPTSLLFGKVFAGAIASLFQMGVILGAVVFGYRLNRELWGGILDFLFNIPNEVFFTFIFFGLFGYLFYAFIYGAIGALVSKTEDISKSTSGVMMIVMVVYFVSLFSLSNPDGIIIKVMSFLPFSSYASMFARVALGTVSIVEVIISWVILLASDIGLGMLAAKIYRMGTLRYGNPIKLGTAIKDVRKEKN